MDEVFKIQSRMKQRKEAILYSVGANGRGRTNTKEEGGIMDCSLGEARMSKAISNLIKKFSIP